MGVQGKQHDHCLVVSTCAIDSIPHFPHGKELLEGHLLQKLQRIFPQDAFRACHHQGASGHRHWMHCGWVVFVVSSVRLNIND